MEFSSKEVKRAIRDFKGVAEDLLSASHNTYSSRVDSFITFIEQNIVLNHIVNPLLNKQIDFDAINYSGNGYWIELKLPINMEDQLAYLLQTFHASCREKFSLDSYLLRVFKKKSFNENISLWSYQVVRPCIRELINKLSDLIEDEVEGKEAIADSVLQIFNIGNISAQHGSNIAIGQAITQSSTNENIVEKIIERVRKENMVDEDKIEEVKVTCEELQEEVKNNEPSDSKLKDITKKLFGLGGKGLLLAAKEIISNEKFSESILSFFLGN
jgi:hypothetical protein